MAKSGDQQIRSNIRRRDISIHVRVSHDEYLLLQSQLQKQTRNLDEESSHYSKYSIQRLMIDAALEREIEPVVLPASADIRRLHELAIALEKNGGLLMAWHKGAGDHFAFRDNNKQFPINIKEDLPIDKKKFVGDLINEYKALSEQIRKLLSE